MTRITAGRFRGRVLSTPRGQITRPTSERVREALGNALYAAGGLEGARVLDLYAGSGALGLELLSRGAASVVLVEHDRSAVAAARANVEKLATPASGAVGVSIVAAEVADYLAAGRGPFDIVVADPPYELPNSDLTAVLRALVQGGSLAPGADVIVERAVRSGELGWPEPLVAVREKRYGDTRLCYGRAP